jgi:uncharacterized membrane protein YhiD involved in acid resistance
MTLPETQDLTLIGALVVAIGFLVRMLFKYIDTQLKDKTEQIKHLQATLDQKEKNEQELARETFQTLALVHQTIQEQHEQINYSKTNNKLLQDIHSKIK